VKKKIARKKKHIFGRDFAAANTLDWVLFDSQTFTGV